MSCGFFERWLMASADGELAGWRAAWLRSHLAGCPKCAQGLAELRRLREVIASRKRDYAAAGQNDPFFSQRLRAAMRYSPETAPDGDVVMAYSTRTYAGKRASGRPAGATLFGRSSVRRLAFASAAVAVVVIALTGLLSPIGRELPLLAPPGASGVSFSDTKAASDTSADPVKFDKPDVDIHVLWVSGLPYLEKENPPGGSGS